jgi:hypothetical protein
MPARICRSCGETFRVLRQDCPRHICNQCHHTRRLLPLPDVESQNIFGAVIALDYGRREDLAPPPLHWDRT